MATQMLEIRCHLLRSRDNGGLTVKVDYPEIDTASGDYYCRVMSGEPNTFHLDAYGVLPQQAIRLALEMVSAKISNVICSEITDSSGQTEAVQESEEEKTPRRKRRK